MLLEATIPDATAIDPALLQAAIQSLLAQMVAIPQIDTATIQVETVSVSP